MSKQYGPKIGVRNTFELYLNLSKVQLFLIILQCVIWLYMVLPIITGKCFNKTQIKMVTLFYWLNNHIEHIYILDTKGRVILNLCDQHPWTIFLSKITQWSYIIPKWGHLLLTITNKNPWNHYIVILSIHTTSRYYIQQHGAQN